MKYDISSMVHGTDLTQGHIAYRRRLGQVIHEKCRPSKSHRKPRFQKNHDWKIFPFSIEPGDCTILPFLQLLFLCCAFSGAPGCGTHASILKHTSCLHKLTITPVAKAELGIWSKNFGTNMAGMIPQIRFASKWLIPIFLLLRTIYRS